MLACHHRTPQRVPQPVRISCEFLARFFSSRLEAAEAAAHHSLVRQLREARGEFTEQLRKGGGLPQTLAQTAPQLMTAVQAHGMALCRDDHIHLWGNTPTLEQVQLLVQWLAQQDRYLVSTHHLSADYPNAASFQSACSGLLSVRITLAATDSILWFRPEVIGTVHWAGNPDKPVEMTEAGKRISPRRSFEMWKQTVAGQSQPWQDAECEFALAVRQSAAEALLQERNQEITRLNTELARSNVELDSFAYAAGHDLQEPLRAVRAYSELLARRTKGVLDTDATEFIHLIRDAAERMSNLITGLLQYSQLGGSERIHPKAIHLEDVLRVVLLNVDQSVQATGAVVTHDPLPVVQADQHQLVQLLQNLISNAIKYCKPTALPRIHVAAEQREHDQIISVRDNGQGLSMQYAEEIFGVFKRLHGRHVSGSGIGLALCKRIVERHGGRIWVESQPGVGSTFYFTLPRGQISANTS